MKNTDENIVLSLNKQTLSAFSLILAGMLILQGWWLRAGMLSTEDIEKIVAPIKQDQASITERIDVVILNFMSLDQRLRLIEQSIGIVKKTQADKGQTKAIINHLDSLQAQIDRWRKDTVFSQPCATIPILPPDNHTMELDTMHRNQVRRNRMQLIPYLPSNQ